MTKDQIKGQIAQKEAEFQILVQDQQKMDAETKRMLDAYNAKTAENNVKASEMRGYVAALQAILPQEEPTPEPEPDSKPKRTRKPKA